MILMAESATRPKPQWDMWYIIIRERSRRLPCFPPPYIVQREAAQAKRSSRFFFSFGLSSADPPDHPPGRVILVLSEPGPVQAPANPTSGELRRRGKFSLFLRFPPPDPRADDDARDPKGRNCLFGHFKSHNLYADDDRMDVFQALPSPHDLPVGRYEHRRRPGGPPPQRVSIGPQAGYGGCEHDTGRYKCRARED